MNTVTFRGTPRALRKLLLDLPKLLAGKVPDPYGVVRGFKVRVASALLSQVQQDFVRKARGGTGRDGVKWLPLAASTVAARLRKAGGGAKTGKGKGKAKGKYAGSVEILRDTGELFRSLSPGVEDRPSNAPGQVLRTTTNRIVVGTNKKTWHQKGTKRLPARRLWPADGKIPPAWRPAVKAAMKRGVAAIVTEYVRRGAR